jgi:hypothetical protein
MVNIEKIKLLHKDISQTHLSLINTLDSVELEILPPSHSPNKPSKVAIDISLFEEIANLASQLYDKDTQLSQLLKPIKSSAAVKAEIKDLKRSAMFMRRTILENSRNIQKDIKKISIILNEYKERCRIGFVGFLKGLEVDLRKTLKPLVPSDVIDEQINFRPIATDPELLASLNSSREVQAPSENTVDKLNNHIQLLVNTLEEVAKSLITITQNTYKCYYELVDPSLLYSEPPSPLAAPLPEYFSYDISNISEENRKKNHNIVLSAKAKEKLVSKIIQIQKVNGVKNLLPSDKIQENLEKILKNNIKEADLFQFFKEEGIPVSEREKLVFEVIHSERAEGRDVCLEEVIGLNSRKTIETKQNRLICNKENREHLKTSIDSNDEFEMVTLETVVDEKERANGKGIGDKKFDIPNLNLNGEGRGVLEKREMNVMPRVRASTPGKIKKEKKTGKRYKTPLYLKKQRVNK